MTELEARRLLMADPRRPSPELREEIARHPALAEFHEQLLDLDRRTHAALTEAPLPHGLADRMVLGARYRPVSKARLAIAAAIAAAAIMIPWHFAGPASDEFAMMDHVRDSRWELGDNPGVSQGIARASLAELGVGLAKSSYRIRHLGHCIVAGRQGRHFTIDSPQGVISFVVLPASTGSLAKDSLREGDTVGVFEKRGDILLGAFGNSAMEGAALRRLMKGVFT